MKLTAIYSETHGGELRHMRQSDYMSKKDFTRDLRMNGYKAVAILTDDQIREFKKDIKENFGRNTPRSIYLGRKGDVKEYIKNVLLEGYDN
jgi:hypothetical protein